LKDSGRICREQTTSYEDYLPEAGVEPRDMAGVRRTLPAETNGQDNGEVSTFDLLEKILSRNNMNAAYKQEVRSLIRNTVIESRNSDRFILCLSAGYMEYIDPTPQYINNLILYITYGLECVMTLRN
jgi:hypothetical protein